jgi:hypothetical protein
MSGQFYVPMGGNGSGAVNSQLLPFPMLGSFFPNTAMAPQYYGNGQPPATIPLNYMNQPVGGTGVTEQSLAATNPWSFTSSPLPWVLLALVLGLVWLRIVHWR